MNIAHLLPFSAKFPLAKHNGRYEWALRLALLQAQHGHQVTIYAAPGSSCDDPSIIWGGLDTYSGDKLANNIALITKAFNNTRHDIFHSHFDSLHYILAEQTNKPIVSTQHWFPNQTIADAANKVSRTNIVTVAPTNYMADADERLGIKEVEVIYHGIDLSLFTKSDKPTTDRLVFVGRITPNKGVLEAIEAAITAGIGLDIIGKLNVVDKPYWDKISPLIDGEQIKYHGPKSLEEVALALSTAKGFIFPSREIEAFGQVTVEAQACGTPVIISDKGASRELVTDSVTGFVVNSPDEFVRSIKKLDQINRQDCIDFARKFDIKIMFEKYEELYSRLVA